MLRCSYSTPMDFPQTFTYLLVLFNLPISIQGTYVYLTNFFLNQQRCCTSMQIVIRRQKGRTCYAKVCCFAVSLFSEMSHIVIVMANCFVKKKPRHIILSQCANMFLKNENYWNSPILLDPLLCYVVFWLKRNKYRYQLMFPTQLAQLLNIDASLLGTTWRKTFL